MNVKLPCPFGDPKPPGRPTFVIPMYFRRQLALIQRERTRLNGPFPVAKTEEEKEQAEKERWDYVRKSVVVERQFQAIEEALLRLARAKSACIEYHTDWRYSISTSDARKAEAAAALERARHK